MLRKPCPECGFDTASFPREQTGRLIRDAAARFADMLVTDPDVRDRPEPEKWSPLEYSCHVRDVFHIFAGRLELMLTTDGPLFANWDQDETAIASRYVDQSPPAVSKEIMAEASALADAVRITQVSTLRGANMSTWLKPGSSTRRKSRVWLWRMQSRSPVSCCWRKRH